MVTSKGIIAVIGATGNQGGEVMRALLRSGWHGRALTRNAEGPLAQALKNPGVHVVTANMNTMSTLTKVFKDVSGIFSVQNFWDLGIKEEVRLGTHVIRAALDAGTPYIVYSSGIGADRQRNVAAIDGKAILEERLRSSRLPFTILRPGLFMDDFLGASLPFAKPIQALLNSRRPLVGRLFLATLRAAMPPNSTIPLTTLNDVARFAVWAFDHPVVSPGQTYEGSRQHRKRGNLVDIMGANHGAVPSPYSRVKDRSSNRSSSNGCAVETT